MLNLMLRVQVIIGETVGGMTELVPVLKLETFLLFMLKHHFQTSQRHYRSKCLNTGQLIKLLQYKTFTLATVCMYNRFSPAGEKVQSLWLFF